MHALGSRFRGNDERGVSNLLRRHLAGAAAGLVDVAAAGPAGDFLRLACRVFERGRLHRLFGRRLRFDRVGLRLGQRARGRRS